MDPGIDEFQEWGTIKRDETEEAVNNGNVVQSWHYRERGCDPPIGPSNKTVLENVAEDILVNKCLKNQRCDLPGYPRSTFLMVFSPDGTKVASTHGNHNIYVSELASGKHVCILKGHPRTPWCIAFHPSHPQLIGSGCLGGQVRVWDSTGGSETWTVETETVISSLAFHPRDQLLVIATFSELYFWNWSQPAPFTRVSTNNFNEKVKYVAFDSLGFKLITGIICSESVTPNSAFREDIPHSRNGADNGNNGDGGGPEDRGPRADLRDNIVNSYQHLVHRYDILVRNYQRLFMARHQLINSRTPSTIDRGTDPMETETSANNANNANASTSASTSDRGGGAAPGNNESGRSSESLLISLVGSTRRVEETSQEERPSPSQALLRFAELERRLLLAATANERTNPTSTSQDTNRGSSRTNIFVSPRPNTLPARILIRNRSLRDALLNRLPSSTRTREETTPTTSSSSLDSSQTSSSNTARPASNESSSTPSTRSRSPISRFLTNLTRLPLYTTSRTSLSSTRGTSAATRFRTTGTSAHIPPRTSSRNLSREALISDYLDESTGWLVDAPLSRPTEPVTDSLQSPSSGQTNSASSNSAPADINVNTVADTFADIVMGNTPSGSEDPSNRLDVRIMEALALRHSRPQSENNTPPSIPQSSVTTSAMGLSESNSDSDDSREVPRRRRSARPSDSPNTPSTRRSNRVVIDLNPSPGQNRQDRFQFTRRPVEGTLRTFLTRLYKSRFGGRTNTHGNNESNGDLNGNNSNEASSSSNVNNNSDDSGLSDASAPSPSQPNSNINEPSTSTGTGSSNSNTSNSDNANKAQAAIRVLNKHTRILTLMLRTGRQTSFADLLSMWDGLRRRVLAIEMDRTPPPDLSNDQYSDSVIERFRLIAELSRSVINDMPSLSVRRMPNCETGVINVDPSTSTSARVNNDDQPSSSTQESQPSTSRSAAQPNRRLRPPGYFLLRKRLNLCARIRLNEDIRRNGNMRRSQRPTLTAPETRSSRSQIRLRAMQVLSIIFFLMIDCLEENDALTQVVFTMLQTFKRALRITALLLTTVEAGTREEPMDVDESNPVRMDNLTWLSLPSTSGGSSNAGRSTNANRTPTNKPANRSGTKRKVSTKQNSSQTCNITATSSASTSNSRQRDIEPPWSNRLAVQISAANRNNSSTARSRREQYIESRREKALHKCNPAAHPISKRKLLPPSGSNRIPSVRYTPSRPRAPRQAPRPRNQGPPDLASIASINFQEPGPSSLFSPSTSASNNESQEINVDEAPDSSTRNELYRIAQLNATRARNAARERLRRLQAIRFFSSLRDPELTEEYSTVFDDPNLPPRRRHRPIVVHRTEQLESVLNHIGVPVVQVNGMESGNEEQANQPVIARVQPIILAQNFVLDDVGGVPGVLDSSFMPEMLPVHRVQAWDFTSGSPPDISNRTKNLVVQRCRIHNDASIDISKDGRLLVALLPVPRLRNSIHRLGVYSLDWGTLGQCLHTAALEQSAVSVALSPTSRYLAVGLGSRRFTYLPHPRNNVFALLYKLSPPENAKGAAMTPIKELEQNWEQQFTSLNCLRWAPQPGQGLVYANNTGQLILMN